MNFVSSLLCQKPQSSAFYQEHTSALLFSSCRAASGECMPSNRPGGRDSQPPGCGRHQLGLTLACIPPLRPCPSPLAGLDFTLAGFSTSQSAPHSLVFEESSVYSLASPPPLLGPVVTRTLHSPERPAPSFRPLPVTGEDLAHRARLSSA